MKRATPAAMLAAAMMLPAGCATIGFGGSPTLEVSSDISGAVLTPEWRTAVYRFADFNTADIYLSDLPLRTIASEDLADLDNAAGSVMHIRYFLAPKAGRTPISFDASNIIIRHLVFAPATAGLYGGGGFMLPRDDAGDPTFEGRVRNATMRLVESGPGFADRLGAARVDGFVSAALDDAAANAVARTFSNILRERVPKGAAAPPR